MRLEVLKMLRLNLGGEGKRVVVALFGTITLGEGSMVLREAVGGLLDQGCKRIVLDFEGVSYVDPSGLGEIVSLCTRRGARVRCINVSHIGELMAMTKVLTMDGIGEDETPQAA
jgi:anti-sigma B factor antagonist